MIPSISLSIITGTYIGLAAHLLFGGSGRKLAFLVVVSVIGFIIGDTVANILSVNTLALGPTNMLTGSLGSVTSVIAAAILIRRTPVSF